MSLIQVKTLGDAIKAYSATFVIGAATGYAAGVATMYLLSQPKNQFERNIDDYYDRLRLQTTDR